MSYRNILIVVVLALSAGTVLAQPVPSALTLQPFPDKTLVETYDQPIFQSASHAKPTNGGPSRGAGIVWYDSYGRAQFDRDGNSPFDLGYRYLQVSINGGTSVVPANDLNDMSIAGGFHMAANGNDKISYIGGLGYSGDKPFQDVNGLYGIGHVVYQHPLDTQNSVVLSLDYNGNSELLPDVPLPGVGYNHVEDKFDYLIGFPESNARLTLAPNTDLRARYAIPYTADVDLEYHFTKNFSIYGQAAHFFHGFELSHQAETDRLFEEMTRVELGVRIIYGELVDISISGGYAMDQDFYRGWDVRDLHRIARVSDEPYLGFILRGRF